MSFFNITDIKESKIVALEKERKLPEELFRKYISNLLTLGVILASLVVFFGGVYYFIVSGNPSVNYQVFQGEPRELSSPLAIINSALSGNPLGIIQFGLLLLIATPVARVFLSVVVFIWQGDVIYSLVTLLVLSGLIFSFVSAYL
jgi:uncharacterized membrane protein